MVRRGCSLMAGAHEATVTGGGTAVSGVVVARSRRVAVPENPYPGLRPYQIGEEVLFFGRDRAVNAMVDVLAAQRLLVVLGSSGSGKSSLVNCGLVPALHRGTLAEAGSNFRVAQLRPGQRAIGALARALARPGLLFDRQPEGLPLSDVVESSLRLSRGGIADVVQQARVAPGVSLLIVVDQFEQLFRFGKAQSVTDEQLVEERTAFVSLLLEASQQRELPLYVVITMRSDFLGDCCAFEGLPAAINRGQYLVPRMNRDERRLAIRGPALVAGADLDPVLVTRLVNEVGDDPDQLSVLQHALNRTYDHWKHNGGIRKGAIGADDYEAVGTMKSALDQHADALVSKLGEARQRLAERIFRALTDAVSDARGVRRPLACERLCRIVGAPRSEVQVVLDVFRSPDASLLMPPLSEALQPDSVIDISHESLMRAWNRLRVWAKREAECAQMYRRLAGDATLHARKEMSLWHEPELSLGRNWQVQERPNPAWAELYGGDFEQAAEYLRRSWRAKRWRQGLALGFALAFAGTALGVPGATAWAERERGLQLKNEAQIARQTQLRLENEVAAQREVERAAELRLAHETAERDRHEQEQARLLEELAVLESTTPTLHQEVKKLRARIRALRVEVISLREHNARDSYEISTIRAETSFLDGRNEVLTSTLSQRQAELEALSQRLALLKLDQERLIAANEAAERQLDALQRENERLRLALEAVGFESAGEHGGGFGEGTGLGGVDRMLPRGGGGVSVSPDIERFEFLQDQSRMQKSLIQEYGEVRQMLEAELDTAKARRASLKRTLDKETKARAAARSHDAAVVQKLGAAYSAVAQTSEDNATLRLAIEREQAIADELKRAIGAVSFENERMKQALQQVRR